MSNLHVILAFIVCASAKLVGIENSFDTTPQQDLTDGASGHETLFSRSIVRSAPK
jgi:hypothetical protein